MNDQNNFKIRKVIIHVHCIHTSTGTKIQVAQSLAYCSPESYSTHTPGKRNQTPSCSKQKQIYITNWLISKKLRTYTWVGTNLSGHLTTYTKTLGRKDSTIVTLISHVQVNWYLLYLHLCEKKTEKKKGNYSDVKEVIRKEINQIENKKRIKTLKTEVSVSFRRRGS